MANGEEKKPVPDRPLSLLDNYGSSSQGSNTTVDAKKPGGRIPSYNVEPYVPIPRPVTGQALITTGQKPVSIPVFVDTSSPRGVQVASDINSILNADRYSKSDAEALWDQLPQQTQDALTQIARSQGGRSGKAFWERTIQSSYLSTKQGFPQSPWDIIQSSGGEVTSASGRGGRGGRAAAYDGPVVSENVSQYSEGDIARLATDIGLELLGRQPTEQELNRINKRVRAAEMATPAVTTQEQVAPGKTRTVTEAGLAQSDREQIMREVLQQNPEFEQYQVNTTVLDTILSTIRKDRAALYG